MIAQIAVTASVAFTGLSPNGASSRSRSSDLAAESTRCRLSSGTASGLPFLSASSTAAQNAAPRSAPATLSVAVDELMPTSREPSRPRSFGRNGDRGRLHARFCRRHIELEQPRRIEPQNVALGLFL